MTLHQDDGSISWTSLLAHWTAIAQASLALPANADGDRWRSAVPEIIGLQAITHALADLDRTTDAAERAVGQDKAELLLRDPASKLHHLWRNETMPAELDAMLNDARAALEITRLSGVEWTLADSRPPAGTRRDPRSFEHPAELVAQMLAMGFTGDVYLPAPGISMMDGAPVAFARQRTGGPPAPDIAQLIEDHLAPGTKSARQPCFRQVYRQYDFGTGRVRRDFVLPERSELAAGQPLLVPVLLSGIAQPVPLAPPPGAIDRLADIPVEFGS